MLSREKMKKGTRKRKRGKCERKGRKSYEMDNKRSIIPLYLRLRKE
jgi:hypothetical protein